MWIFSTLPHFITLATAVALKFWVRTAAVGRQIIQKQVTNYLWYCALQTGIMQKQRLQQS